MQPDPTLSRRERQVTDILYSRGAATVAEVRDALADGTSYSATRMVLQRLHKRGKVTAERDGVRYVYRPAVPTTDAGALALKNLVQTFFAGSTTQAVTALLGDQREVSEAELDALEALVREARKKHS